MKKFTTLLLVLGVFTIVGLTQVSAQYRTISNSSRTTSRDVTNTTRATAATTRAIIATSNPQTNTSRNSSTITRVRSTGSTSRGNLDLYGYTPTVETPNNEFNFTYDFSDVRMLLNLDAAMRAAEREALNKWLGKQEDVFKDNINRILGANYSNFKDAQKAFITKRETNLIANATRTIAASHNRLATKLALEQEVTTSQLVALRACIFGECGTWGSIPINGFTARDLAINFAQIDQLILHQIQLHEEYTATTLARFAQQEFEAAQNRRWANSVSSLGYDQPLLDSYINQHIANYSKKSHYDKVVLMAAYLNAYVAVGPVQVPNLLQIPRFWDNNSLLALAKKRAVTTYAIEELVFAPDYIENSYKACYQQRPRHPRFGVMGPDLCTPRKKELLALRERIIEDHKKALDLPILFIKDHLNNTISGSPEAGKINDLDYLEYTNVTRDWAGTGNTLYELKNGLFLGAFVGKRKLVEADLYNSESSLNFDNRFYYIFNEDTEKWHELTIPAKGSPGTIEPKLITYFWNGGKFIGRYILPIEDAIIFVDGKDWDGVEQSRALAAGFILVGIVPGSKIVKPLSKVAKGTIVTAKIYKVAGKTVKLTFKKIDGLISFGNRSQLRDILNINEALYEAHHIVPWAKKTDGVVQKAADAGFHMNDPTNGVALEKFSRITGDGLHGNHPAYDTFVQKQLDDFQRDFPNATGQQAKDFLETELIPDLIDYIEAAKNYTGGNLNDYFKNVVN